MLLNESDLTVNAVIVRPAVVEPVPDAAVMVAEVDAVTADVDTVKVAVVAPEETVTVGGTVTDDRLDESETVVPSDGAVEPNVRVPVEDVPPRTAVGDNETPLRTGGVTVRLPVAADPKAPALMEAVMELFTG